MGERTQQLQELGLDVRTFAAVPVPPAVLKAAFRSRAKQCHPDATAGSTRRFQRLNAAHASLLRDHTHAAFVARAATHAGGGLHAAHAEGSHREWGQLYASWRSSALRRGANNLKLAVVLSAVTVGACCVAWCDALPLPNPS